MNILCWEALDEFSANNVCSTIATGEFKNRRNLIYYVLPTHSHRTKVERTCHMQKFMTKAGYDWLWLSHLSISLVIVITLVLQTSCDVLGLSILSRHIWSALWLSPTMVHP